MCPSLVHVLLAVFISLYSICFLQYDAKLLKLQKHNVKTQSVHQSSVTSDIYRQVSRASIINSHKERGQINKKT